MRDNISGSSPLDGAALTPDPNPPDSRPPASGPLSRRALVKASLGVGFCAAIAPVRAQTIATSAEGLIAGEVKVPAGDAEIPAYRAMPEGGGPFPTVARGPRDLRRPRAHQGRLPALGQARLLRDRAGTVRAPGRRGAEERTLPS